ncbi:MAG: hypothetical protein V2I48_13240 [Xanthomonadales bacterium]|jgi:phage terminase small subunit|nr:hypothetical protein [Xanthomonadales bacterium]
MPTPRKPPKLKALAGTDRPCRRNPDAVEFDPLSDVPDAPDWLPNAHAVREFDRLARILHANKILTEADVSALAHSCALHGKIVQLWTAGEAPTGHMMSQYRGLINDLGLTPVSRGKVKPGDSAKSDNPFATNGRKKGA